MAAEFGLSQRSAANGTARIRRDERAKPVSRAHRAFAHGISAPRARAHVLDRGRAAGGVLIFRNEDLDRERTRPEFVAAMYEDLRWLGVEWQEGPDVPLGVSSDAGGPFGPYSQSERREVY